MDNENLPKNNKIHWLIIVVVILVLGGLGYGGYWAYGKVKSKIDSKSTNSANSSKEDTKPVDSSTDLTTQFNDYKSNITTLMNSLQSSEGSETNKEEKMKIASQALELLQEFKQFLETNKDALSATIDVTAEIKSVEDQINQINSRSSSGSGSSSSDSSNKNLSTSLSLALPFDKNNYAVINNGVWPFCVHGGEHPEGHGGIDFDLSGAAEIKAAAAGTVEEMMFDEAENGYNIFINHGNKATGYTPIRNPQVQKGDKITQGQVLGTAGDDGKGVNYLHFEVNAFTEGGRVCPYQYFNSEAKTAFDEMFAKSIYPEKSSESNICNCELVPVSQR